MGEGLGLRLEGQGVRGEGSELTGVQGAFSSLLCGSNLVQGERHQVTIPSNLDPIEPHNLARIGALGVRMPTRRGTTLQGYLAHKKTPPSRTLQ